MALTDQSATFRIDTIKDSRGRDAQVDGPITWEISDPGVLSADASADPTGRACTVKTVGAGTAKVTAVADADLGPGVSRITYEFPDVTVTQNPNSQAATMTGTADAFQDNPPNP